eukprot:5275298-Pleurochrysis_carterae.AAC.1
MDAEGAITCTTDASDVDGVGGYAFTAGAPGEVWLVSEWWPVDVATMLQRSAMPSAERQAEERAAGSEGPLPT